jgi:hypothetical protein
VVVGKYRSAEHSPYYKNPEEIRTEMESKWELYRVESGGGFDHDLMFSAIFKAYVNANRAKIHDIILGSADLRTDNPLLQNFGTLSVTPEHNIAETVKFFESISGKRPSQRLVRRLSQDHLQRGSIVHDKDWHVFLNDAFMLGAIHSGKEFQIKHIKVDDTPQLISDDQLWDEKANRFRVFGRELAMLSISGYIPAVYSIDGKRNLVFLPPEESTKPKNMTFNDVKARLSNCNLQTLKRYLSESFELTGYQSNPGSPVPDSTAE